MLRSSGVADVAISGDESKLYVATRTGMIASYDLNTLQPLSSWQVGTRLGGLSVSEDGTYLLATERSPASGQSIIYKVSTATGAAQTTNIAGGAFYDVEIVDAHNALVTGGQPLVQRFDLDTGAFSSVLNSVYYSNNSVMAEDGPFTLLAEPGISNGPLLVYDDRAGKIVAQGDDYQSPANGFNFGSQAVNAKTGMIAQFIYYGSINLYTINASTSHIVYTANFDVGGRVDGLTFDPSGRNLFVYQIDVGQVVKYDVAARTEVSRYDVGTSEWHNGIGYGSQLKLYGDGRYLAISDTSDLGRLQIMDLAIKGTAGADALTGTAGDDIFVVNATGDTVTESASGGIDRIDTTLASYVLGANLENLTLTGSSAVSGTGNALDNVLKGNALANSIRGLDGGDAIHGGAGDDMLDGGDGSDTLDGGAGADVMTGGSGNDAFFVDAVGDSVVETIDGGIDSIETTLPSYTLGDAIENLVLTGSAAINGTGNGLANSLTGNGIANSLRGLDGADVLNGGAGNDSLDGGLGNDTLDGGAGADIMTGGSGQDSFIVNDSADAVLEGVGGGNDQVTASLSWTLGAGQEVELITAAAGITMDLTGNEYANSLTGNDRANILRGLDGSDVLIAAGGNDTLDGGAGQDIMTGGTGDDNYVIDNAGDSVVETAGGGSDRVLTSVSWTLAVGQEIEAVTATGSALDLTGNEFGNSLTGNERANILRGLDGADVLDGGTGDDTLEGGVGNDRLTGGDDHDVIYGGDGADILYGGNGNDHLYGQSAIGGSDGADQIIAGDGSDYLQGNAGSDVLDGGNGSDRINGGADDDTIIGGTGNDTINGNRGADVISGGDGNDFVRGGQEGDRIDGGTGDDVLLGDLGADSLQGGLGSDVLTGGAEADIFYFGSGEASFATTGGAAYLTDVITDFANGIDHIRLSFGTPLAVLGGSAFVNFISAAVAADSMLGTQGSSSVVVFRVGGDAFLFYDLGPDSSLQAIKLVGLANTTLIDTADFV